MKIQQSFAWWCFGRTMPAPDLIAHALRIGYAGAEMVPEELWPQLKQAGLKIITSGGHNGIASGLNRMENHDRIEAELRANLHKAVQWEIPCLIVFSGNREGMHDHEGMKNTIAGLQRMAPLAEAAGVTLVMELLNSKVDHADYMCDRTAWGVEVCKAVNSPRVKLLYDIYHMQIMEGDVIRTIRDHIAWIGHMHTAGNPGRHELDETQELYYPAIARAIAESGYAGYVGQEFMPIGNALAGLEQAYKACDV